jgi:hypothetical protein
MPKALDPERNPSMTKPTNRWLPALAAVLGVAAALTAVQALAFVNPNFTPKNVETASKVIFTVRVESLDTEGKLAQLAVVDVIKGELAAKKIRLDLKSATPDAKPEDFLELLKAAEKRPALVAAGEFEGKPCALMHVEACWVRLAKGADDASWTFDRIDTSLNGTFNGGTDMLIETMKFMRKFPSAPIMPVSGGVQWTEHTKLGTLPGKAAALLAVDVNADGKLDLFAACPEGDRIFLQKAGGAFEEKALEPGSKSLAAAWADFDGDGRPDLASLGKDGLKVWLQKEPGKFAATAVAEVGEVENASPTVAVIDLEPDGKPDLVVGAGSVPVVCKNDGKGALRGEALPALILQEGKGRGAAGPCVVADFDADGFADIVEVFQSNGLIRRGKPGGFDPPAKCGALMGKPKSRSACVADLDGDGLLDIFLIGGGSTPYMLQNRGGTKFEEVMRLTGESGYIIQPGASCAALGDYNNDTFVDIYAGYEEEPAQAFFNRGFRSFAINEQLKFKDDDLPGCEKGQAAMVWADFDGSGALKLATALANGDLYFSRTDLGQADRPLFLSVPVGKDVKSAAPLVVRFYLEGRCLGARVAERFGPSALLGVAEPGTYTIKYRAADGREVSLERDPSQKSGAPKATGQAAPPKTATGGPTAGPGMSEGVEGRSSYVFLTMIGGLVILAVILGLVLVLRKKGTGGEQP